MVNENINKAKPKHDSVGHISTCGHAKNMWLLNLLRKVVQIKVSYGTHDLVVGLFIRG